MDLLQPASQNVSCLLRLVPISPVKVIRVTAPRLL